MENMKPLPLKLNLAKPYAVIVADTMVKTTFGMTIL